MTKTNKRVAVAEIAGSNSLFNLVFIDRKNKNGEFQRVCNSCGIPRVYTSIKTAQRFAKQHGFEIV